MEIIQACRESKDINNNNKIIKPNCWLIKEIMDMKQYKETIANKMKGINNSRSFRIYQKYITAENKYKVVLEHRETSVNNPTWLRGKQLDIITQ